MSISFYGRCGASDLFWMRLCELSGQVLNLHHQVEICFQIYWNPFPNVLSTAVHISTIWGQTLKILHIINHLSQRKFRELGRSWSLFFVSNLIKPSLNIWLAETISTWREKVECLCWAGKCRISYTPTVTWNMDLEIFFPTKVTIYWTVINCHLWLRGSTLLRLAVQQQGGHNFLLLCWLLLYTDHLLLFFLQSLNFLLYLHTMRASAASLKEISEI